MPLTLGRIRRRRLGMLGDQLAEHTGARCPWSYAYGRPPADAPEPLAPIPVDPLRALAVKLLRLEGDDFRRALAGIFAHEVSTAPSKALSEGGNPDA